MPFKYLLKKFLENNLKFFKSNYKQDFRIINSLKNLLNVKLTLNLTLKNVIYFFLGLIILSVILLYLLAPFNYFLLKLLLVVKVIIFLGLALVILLINK